VPSFVSAFVKVAAIAIRPAARGAVSWMNFLSTASNTF
jgi:hypothetical protein